MERLEETLHRAGRQLTTSCPPLQLPKRDWHVVRHGSHYHQVHLARQGACACGDPHQVSARDTMLTVAITAPQGQAGLWERGL